MNAMWLNMWEVTFLSQAKIVCWYRALLLSRCLSVAIFTLYLSFRIDGWIVQLDALHTRCQLWRARVFDVLISIPNFHEIFRQTQTAVCVCRRVCVRNGPRLNEVLIVMAFNFVSGTQTVSSVCVVSSVL